MPTFPLPPAAEQDDLVLRIAGKDRAVREYHIPPCTAAELMDLVAVKAVLETVGSVGAGRVSAENFAASLTTDASLLERIQRLVDGGMTTEAILARPLGPASDQMLADGVGKGHYVLASLAAMAWHINGDDAARAVWAMGR